MIDSIMDAVKGQVVSAIAEKTGLPVAQAEQTIPIAKDSITDGIMSAVSGGNVDGILGMLTSAVGGSDNSSSAGGGGLLQNMVYKGIAGSFISNLTSKLGLSEGIASTLSSIALPMILNRIGGATQAAGDTDGIDAGSMMSALGLDAGSLLGGLVGGKAGGAADLLGQAANMLGKGDDSKNGNGDGLLGKIGGMFK